MSASRAGWLADRPCTPHRQPRRLSAAKEEPILRARRETNLGPGRLAGICRRARSTIWKVLHRHGLSQRRRSARETYRRYEWSRPDALLHVDVARLARFGHPGHRAPGLRAERHRSRGAATSICTPATGVALAGPLGASHPSAVFTTSVGRTARPNPTRCTGRLKSFLSEFEDGSMSEVCF